MANFDPAYALLRLFYQTAEGVVPQTGGKDTQILNEGFASTPGVVERTAISPVELAALRGKTANAPAYAWDAINPDDPCILTLLPLGFVTTTTPVAGVYYHDLSATAGDDPTPGQITAMIWRDGTVGQRFVDYLINSSAISFGEDALVGAQLQGVASYGDYWADPVHAAGAGTGTMRLRGVWGEEFAGEGIRVEVVTTAPLVVKARRVSAGAYGANQAITIDTWKSLTDENDLLFGDLASPVQLRVSGAVAIGDVYTFAAISAAWVPSLADPDNVVAEVYSHVLVNGAEFELKSGTLTVTKGAEPRKGFGGVRYKGTRRRGILKPVLSFTREAIDEFVRTKLETGQTFDFVLKLYSASKIGATAFNYGLEITLAGIRMSGSTAVVSSGTGPQEDQVTTTGGTLTARIINSTASML